MEYPTTDLEPLDFLSAKVDRPILAEVPLA